LLGRRGRDRPPGRGRHLAVRVTVTAVRGTEVDVPAGDGVADAYLTHPADGEPRPAVLFYTDAFGLRPAVRAMADRLAGAGHTVLVPNVFHRRGRAPVTEVPAFVDDRARGPVLRRMMPVMRQLTPERAMRDAGAYLRWLAACPAARSEEHTSELQSRENIVCRLLLEKT